MYHLWNCARTFLVSLNFRTSDLATDSLTVHDVLSPYYFQLEHLSLDVGINLTASFLFSPPPPFTRLESLTMRIPYGFNNRSQIFNELPIVKFNSATNLHS
jgi:hypothetical protein